MYGFTSVHGDERLSGSATNLTRGEAELGYASGSCVFASIDPWVVRPRPPQA